MTLFDCPSTHGKIAAIGGDPETHRWLADSGLLGLTYTVRARRRNAVLIDFGAGGFSAAVSVAAAKQILVVEG